MIRHVRRKPPKRSPHRAGRITPDHVLDRDPRGFTLCGAEATTDDVDHRTGGTKSYAAWLADGRADQACSECMAIRNPEAQS